VQQLPIVQQEVDRVAAITQQQKKAECKAADESLTADERETSRIASMVDWTDLLDPNGGCEILDTACRAITLEQLTKLFNHSERRLKAGEKWNKWTPDNPNVEVTEMDQVICNWETVT
jgi:hypothetical protein